MRIVVMVLTCLWMTAALPGAVAVAHAADATLFYAPGTNPAPPPVAPLAMPVPPPFVAGTISPRQNGKRFEAPRNRVCFNPAETREKIAAHRLTEPFRALRTGRLQGQALRAKLCRWTADQFVYEVSVLRSDGRIVHIYMNALNGQAFGAFGDFDRH